jgi:hypothetical protein
MSTSSTPPSTPSTSGGAPRKRRAGVFDVRTIIGLLLGIYGVVLVLMGLFGTTEEELTRADGINVNLWTGIALVVAAAIFFAWARLRPVLVPADHEAEQHRQDQPGH